MKILIIAVSAIAILLLLFLFIGNRTETNQAVKDTKEHLYVSWDTMEFDKCVTYWLVTRFIDPDAEFKLYPQGTEITEGIAFDIPGAEWSRKHLKCTSMCILESMDINDPAVERIVEMAGQIELNFWQLDHWPETQKVFYEVREIIDDVNNPLEVFRKAAIYFDCLYEELLIKKEES